MRTDPNVADSYRSQGFWGTETVGSMVRRWAKEKPDAVAFYTSVERNLHTFTWSDYDRAADRIAEVVLATGIPSRSRVAVMMPDGPGVHAVYVGLERAGMVCVGIGARAGDREIAHLLTLTGAETLITTDQQYGRQSEEIRNAVTELGAKLTRHILVSSTGEIIDAGAEAATIPTAAQPIDPDELFLLNSTSGTTGLPKCVMHTQNRWFYFHKLAAAAGNFGADEIFFGALPAPFGFGLWTAHFTPAILGAPTVVMDRFDAEIALELLEQLRVTVLCCVSTQFIMLLNANKNANHDLSSLRSMFTGGEAVPYERAAEFEQTTGAMVLQFYGSNETGALSHTSWTTDRETRLRTAGEIIPEMNVRLYDPETLQQLPADATEGQPACLGPAIALGYWGDEQANQKLFTSDGWMLMGDIVRLHDGPNGERLLSVVGRTSDFIIRGGKNISAAAVEAEVSTHPDVAMVAAVPWPDPVFGERVCLYVEPIGDNDVTLESIVEHLRARSVSREWFPEKLIVLPQLPRSSGSKVAKGELRADAARRAAAENA